MIIGEQFIWLHLPKTGGTSTANLFRELGVKDIVVDPDDIDSKHDSFHKRHEEHGLQLEGKHVFVTLRRLTSWLLSDWHHKTRKMGLDLPIDPVRSGLFYSLRLGGIWVTADYWLRFFDINANTEIIRLEHLESDANRMVLPLLPQDDQARIKQLSFPRLNTNQYHHHPETFFKRREIEALYANNPLWKQLEVAAYGDTDQRLPRHYVGKIRKFLSP
jgi:hypothetical protein